MFMIHRYFLILEVSSPVLKGASYKEIFRDKNFNDFCVIHKNHDNIGPQKFGAIQ